MDERNYHLLRSKITGTVQEVILPDFPNDDNTVTTTVTKSRRVSFGTNFVKEFIVDSAVSAQCVSEYEQAFLSSDSSNANSSYSAIESGVHDHSTFVNEKHQPVPPVIPEPDESHPKVPKFASTICFSSDSPTADMEFTEGCLTLAKSILDKKNKEMTVIIQAKPKEAKEDGKIGKDEETKYFDGSQFDMSMTRCLKSKENKREEKRFESEKTKIFSRYDDEMSITRCDKVFRLRQSNIPSDDSLEENFKENQMPLDMIMRHLDKDNSDLESDLFNPEKSFNDVLNSNPFDLSNESEKLNLNESMEISRDFHSNFFKVPPPPPPMSKIKVFTEKETVKLPLLNTSDDFDKQVLNVSKEIILRKDSLTDEKVLPEEDSFLETLPVRVEAEKEVMTDVTFEKEEEMNLDMTLANIIQRSEEMEVDVEEQGEEMEDEIAASLEEFGKRDGVVDENTTLPSPQKDAGVDEGGDEIFERVSPPPEEEEIQVGSEAVDEIEPVSLPKLDNISTEIVLPYPQPDKTDKISVEGETTDEVAPTPFQDEEMAEEPSEMLSPTPIEEKFNKTETTDEIAPPQDAEKTEEPERDEIIHEVTTPRVETEMEDENEVIAPQEDFESATETPQVERPEALEVVDEPVEEITPLMEDTEDMIEREPSLVDTKVIECLREQSKEPGCMWSLKDLSYPRGKSEGFLSFNCNLLESSTTIKFFLKMPKEDSLDSCSVISKSEISLNEDQQLRLPEYHLVMDFGFQKAKKHFEEGRKKVETIRQVSYFMDQMNSFTLKINSRLRQIYSILTLYPGSRLTGSSLSFRLFSFPIFFSSTASIDLTDLFRLSDSSLSFETDFGSFNENKIREIFQKCLKSENPIRDFIIKSTEYLIDLERKTGYVSKRKHIQLLPRELRL